MLWPPLLRTGAHGPWILKHLSRTSRTPVGEAGVPSIEEQAIIAGALESSCMRHLRGEKKIPIDVRIMSCGTPEVLESPGKVVDHLRGAGGSLTIPPSDLEVIWKAHSYPKEGCDVSMES